MNVVFMKHIACSFTAIAALLMLNSGCAAQQSAASTASGFGSQQNATQATSTGVSNTTSPGLYDPSQATKTAPATFTVVCRTDQGVMHIRCHRDWAPNAADRFYNMVDVGFFNNLSIFRAIEGFMFQFGIHGDPRVSSKWAEATIPDDRPVGRSNKRGTISFAQTGRPNSRSCQMFINLRDNTGLDVARGSGSAFVPFGEIIAGHEVMDKIYTGYGENQGDVQGQYKRRGAEYINAKFPKATKIFSITLKEE